MPFRLIINTFKFVYILIKQKPDLVIATGVLAMIPLCLLVKLSRKKLIYIESFAKINSPTLTGAKINIILYVGGCGHKPGLERSSYVFKRTERSSCKAI